MSFETFSSLLERIDKSNIKKLILNGVGEPFLNPNLIDILQQCKRNNIPEVELYTNATLIDDKVMSIFENDILSTIIFSIDGATKESYEKIRCGARFENVLKNISLVSHYKKLNKKIHFVLSQENLDSINLLPGLCEKLHIKSLVVVELIPFLIKKTRRQSEDLRNYMPSQSKNLSNVIFNLKNDCEKLNVKLKIRLGWWKMQCSLPFNHIYINVEGNVSPCCRIQENISMGNLLDKQFDLIWNGKKLLNWRYNMKSNSPPAECVACQSLPE